ncbi:MAG: CvpA family protein [Planctomycetales bacterium]|nr:CvpA family protein [Planctomycetales bacterium]
MIYDGLILLILVLATWRGASRGLAWQVAWIGAILLCFLFATPLSLYVTPHIKLDPPLNRWVAMLVIYMGFSFVSFAIARTLRGWLEETKFQEFDSHLGAIFGLAKGALIALVLTFFLVGLSTSARDYILKTNSGYAAETIFRKLHPIMPREIEHVLEKYDHFGIPVSHDHLRAADRESPVDFQPRRGGAGYRPVDEAADGRADEPGDRIVDERPASGEDSDGPPLADLLKHLPNLFGGSSSEESSDSTGKASTGGSTGLWDSIKSKLPKLPPSPASDPTGAGSTTTRDADRPPGRRDELISGVVRVLSANARERSALAGEIRAGLSGVPDQVAAAALHDWLIDLTGGATDLDPDTDVTSPLDERIVRQLERLGVPESRLSQALRERLRRTEK